MVLSSPNLLSYSGMAFLDGGGGEGGGGGDELVGFAAGWSDVLCVYVCLIREDVARPCLSISNAHYIVSHDGGRLRLWL